ncbi:NUDIX domain-containing protein [Microbacterium sp. H1-D42]|uniref:NUDIX domain-containing protein n=1 Tax=Microbacterium sp. H1-D42 TaxID=2925844 RepID=UPI001F538FCE|nr:NUDIX domain-containing protein [Microbacterium sp. H1-D42]UNK72466.1 NUDIX domain-containing protein [Microbacterium sp. H1-D42]
MNEPRPHLPLRRIIFLRHAMPRVDAFSSPGTWELNPSGIAAAAAHPVSAADAVVVSSPERKALQTAALMTARTVDAVAADARFREVDRVERVHDDFRAARAAWVAGLLDSRHQGWETPDAAAQRFHEGLLAHTTDHLIVGTHGMVLTAWLVAHGRVAPGDAAVAFWEALDFPAVVEVALPLVRVRAMLSDAEGRMILIKRTRPGQQPYWTMPGGGVEATDASPEDALRRELREELGAEIEIGEIMHERPLDSIRSEIFYAANLISLDPALRDGPEFADPSRGSYDIERVHPEELAGVDLRPAELKTLLARV